MANGEGTVNMALMRAMMGLEPEPMTAEQPVVQGQQQQAGGGMFSGMDPNDVSIMLGQLAQAIAPDYWAGRVGGAAAQMGARKKQQQQEQQRAQVLAGEAEQQQSQIARALGLTPDGQAGPTKMTIGADGRFTTTGQVEGTAPPTGEQTVQQQPPRTQTDLSGLSPQQIENVMAGRRAMAGVTMNAREARIRTINADRANRQFEAQMRASERDRSERNQALKRLSNYTLENINEAPADVLAYIDDKAVNHLIDAYTSKYVADVGAAKADTKMPSETIQIMREIEKQSQEQGVPWNQTPMFNLVMKIRGKTKSRQELIEIVQKNLATASPSFAIQLTEKPAEAQKTVNVLVDGILAAGDTPSAEPTIGEEGDDIISTIQAKFRAQRGQ